MSYCLNLNCIQPQNSQTAQICQNCGSHLLLKNRYRSLKQIGQGGFGKTFLAVDEDKPSKPFCVIKQFIPPQDQDNLEKATTLFYQEGIQLDKLGKHPQIPELLAYFTEAENLYLVQEYIKGQNLKEKLKETGTFDDLEIIYLLKNLLPVIQFIHEHHIIHRDIKPENIITNLSGFNSENKINDQYFLVDFGAAKFATGTNLFHTGTVIGTPQYVAPEQGLGKATFSSDLYSLGVTCLYLLTNIEPFELFDISTHQWAWQDYLTTPIKAGLAKILNQMVMMGTQYRYASATHILTDLIKISEDILIRPLKHTKNQQNQENFINNSEIIYPLKPIQLGDKWGYQDGMGKIITVTLFDEVKEFKDNFAPVKIANKWGFINEKGQLVITPKFDQIFAFKKGIAKVKINDKYGYINQTRQIFIPVSFDEIKEFAEGLAAVKINQKWGFINLDAQIIIPVQFDHVLNFAEGLAVVKIGDKYGYINQQGIIVISPQFQEAKSFLNGLAWVETATGIFLINKQGKNMAKISTKNLKFSEKMAVIKINQVYGYLNQSYGLIIPAKYAEALNFHEKLAGVKINQQWGYINQKNQIVIKPQFQEVGNFHEGKAKVKINELWGYINAEGKIIINCQFTEVEDFKQNRARVKLNQQFFYINEQGEKVSEIFDQMQIIKPNLTQVQLNGKWGYINDQGEIISLLFEQINDFTEGLARVKLNHKYGYINSSGKVIIDLIFDDAGKLQEGLARIKINKKLMNLVTIYGQWGYINQQGDIIIPPQFDYALDFAEGLAGIKLNEKWGYINHKGELIIPPQFDEVGLFSEGLAKVKINKKYGYINQKGKLIIPAQFDEAQAFAQGKAKVKLNKWLAKLPFTPSWNIIDKSGNIIE